MEPIAYLELRFLSIQYTAKRSVYVLFCTARLWHTLWKKPGEKKPSKVDLLVNTHKEKNGNELWDTRTWLAEQIIKDKHKQTNKE